MPAMKLEQLPQDCSIAIRDNGGDNYNIYYSNKNQNDDYYKINGKPLGSISIALSKENVTKLIYEIVGAQTERGYGPLLYDVAMELVNKLTGGRGYLKSDPNAVSKFAVNVWNNYFTRGDVSKRPMDSLENEATPTKIDNVNLSAAKEIYGDKPGKSGNQEPWFNKPLSTAFQKDISLLNSDRVYVPKHPYMESKLVEARQSIKTDEPSKIITKYIVNILTGLFAKIKIKIEKNDLEPISILDSQFPNKYITEIKKKIGIDYIRLLILIKPLNNEKILTSNGGEYTDDDMQKGIQFLLIFNRDFNLQTLLDGMNDFVIDLKDTVTHEVTHALQLNKNSGKINSQIASPSKNDPYVKLMTFNYNRYLIPAEIQAYSKGMMRWAKWPELFYNEFCERNLRILTEGIEAASEIYNNEIMWNKNLEIKKESYIRTLKHLNDIILMFRYRMIQYIKKSYNLDLNEQKIWPQDEEDCWAETMRIIYTKGYTL